MILKGSIQKYVWSGWWIKLKFLLCITVAIGGTDLSNMRHTCKMASNQRCDDQPFIIFMCSPWCSSLHPNALHNHWGNWISQASWSQNRKLQTCFKKQTSQYPWNNPCTLVQQITHILGKVYGQLVTCLPLGVHIESHHPQNGEPVPFLNLTPGKIVARVVLYMIWKSLFIVFSSAKNGPSFLPLNTPIIAAGTSSTGASGAPSGPEESADSTGWTMGGVCWYLLVI